MAKKRGKSKPKARKQTKATKPRAKKTPQKAKTPSMTFRIPAKLKRAIHNAADAVRPAVSINTWFVSFMSYHLLGETVEEAEETEDPTNEIQVERDREARNEEIEASSPAESNEPSDESSDDELPTSYEDEDSDGADEAIDDEDDAEDDDDEEAEPELKADTAPKAVVRGPRLHDVDAA